MEGVYTRGMIGQLMLHTCRRPELMPLSLREWDDLDAADASWCWEARVGGHLIYTSGMISTRLTLHGVARHV